MPRQTTSRGIKTGDGESAARVEASPRGAVAVPAGQGWQGWQGCDRGGEGESVIERKEGIALTLSSKEQRSWLGMAWTACASLSDRSNTQATRLFLSCFCRQNTFCLCSFLPALHFVPAALLHTRNQHQHQHQHHTHTSTSSSTTLSTSTPCPPSRRKALPRPRS